MSRANAQTGDTMSVVCSAQANVSNQGQQSVAGTVVGSGGAGTPVHDPSVTGGGTTIPLGATSVNVVNALVTTSSRIVATINQAAADGTLTEIQRVVPAAGSFTIYGNANATSAVPVNYIIFY